MTFQVIKNPENPLCGKSYEEVLKEVKEDGSYLQFIQGDNQTEEICLTAVQQNGYALQCVHNQTDEVCLAAVKQDGYALQFVRNQTEAIVKAAVEQNGWALRYAHNQTEAIVKAALANDPKAMQYVADEFYYNRENVRKITAFMEVVKAWNDLYHTCKTVHPHGGEIEHTDPEFEHKLGDGSGISLVIQDYNVASRLERYMVPENYNVQTDIDLIMNRISLAKPVLPVDEVKDNYVYSEIPKAIEKLISLREDIKRHGSGGNAAKLIHLLASITSF